MTTPIRTALDPFARAYRSAATAAGLPPGAFPYNDQMRWIVGFVVGCGALIGLALVVLWAVAGFTGLGVSGHGLVALILGIMFTTGLGIALMALSFYSDRSGQDEGAHRSDQDHGTK